MNIERKPFIAADAVLLTGDREITDKANHNQASGPASSLFVDGKLIASGGVRLSCGEAWVILSEESRKRLSTNVSEMWAVVERLRELTEEAQRDHELHRIYAEAEVCEKFCRVMGFEKRNNIYVR